MYKDLYHPKVRKDLKKIDPPIRQVIQQKHISQILANPDISDSLLGDLQGIRSYHLSEAGVQFRIAYFVDDQDNTVYFQMIAKRSDFYSLLKKRI